MCLCLNDAASWKRLTLTNKIMREASLLNLCIFCWRSPHLYILLVSPAIRIAFFPNAIFVLLPFTPIIGIIYLWSYSTKRPFATKNSRLPICFHLDISSERPLILLTLQIFHGYFVTGPTQNYPKGYHTIYTTSIRGRYSNECGFIAHITNKSVCLFKTGQIHSYCLHIVIRFRSIHLAQWKSYKMMNRRARYIAAQAQP